MNRPSKAVYALHPVTLREIHRFESVKDAADKFNCVVVNINLSARKGKIFKGYKWVTEERMETIRNRNSSH